VIALRAPAGAKHPVQMIYSDPTCANFVDTPALAAAPYFREVLGSLDCPPRAVRLMRLGWIAALFDRAARAGGRAA
jgi:hypothetical protein